MTRNPEFVRSNEERNNAAFLKMLLSIDVSSENMRALPHDFTKSFSNKELSRKMKIRTQWGSSWEVGISNNPRFYFMEKSGWEKFVSDNALGHNEFITFTHKGKMRFKVNIFKQDGKEVIQPPQSAAFLASSSSPGASSSTAVKFTVIIKRSYFLLYLPIPRSVTKYHMPKEKATFKIHHPDGKRSWDVTYLYRKTLDIFSAGWLRLCKEYPLAVGHTCKFTLIKPDELLLVVSP